MATYRRRKTSDTWHWCANCQHYPRKGYVQSTRKPRSGELCDECQGKQRRRDCR